MADFLRITEIFYSIQGESTWAGLPCTFVRLTGCPLRCTWCDTAYAFHGGERRTFDHIMEEVGRHPTTLVEITGGEPLSHQGALRLADLLLEAGYTVLVETSGSFDVSGLDERVHKIMDLKCPGSGEEHRNLWTNLDHLTERDEVKFVIADRADYEWARGVIRDRLAGRPPAILLSPVHGELPPADLGAWMLEARLPARLNLQIHTVVWGDRRGE
jgi:7-carboxy-7-deazaguanine synthase